ncbi:sugar phosphate isomerase/epimerase family protein [Bogoriella caseilytica]|uniref:Sugar phosphate isomerase/epimerase n=1 Tax=Bogoriella caseilytica TaxID=56055 RepID=A0A3N2BAY5_9MICO|nr:TIM barrel protein [Bogoriella caseilytica]ROR72421.1 sugar phosphate isomerase/epimerase [Bogoriella caseilytica]
MIGLGTYAFFWEMSSRAPEPLDLAGAFCATREHGLGLFQICDYDPLTELPGGELAEAAATARDLGLAVELGTKGIEAGRLREFLRLAGVFDATLVRSMLYAPGSRPSLTEAEAMLREVLPAYADAGVTLALETYEQVATTELAGLIESIASPHLGICLDPGNVVARLESPRDAVERAAPLTVNVHVKDFAFTRTAGWVGFNYAGAPMGSGLHDYPHLLHTVRPAERGINEVVEHWLPWQGDPATTIATEREWTRTTVEYLREIHRRSTR